MLKPKTKSRLMKDKWYHATTIDSWNNICKMGIRAQHNRLNSQDTDFGYGFYLTDTAENAEGYIKRLVYAGMRKQDEIVIIEFEITPLEWYESGYNLTVFEAYDDNFAKFVFNNRLKNYNGEFQHSYDIIYGVMSDSYPTKLFIDLEMGKITKEEVLCGLKKSTKMKQLSLHNQDLCDIISPSRAYHINFETMCRKELNILEYRNNGQKVC